MKTSSVSPVVRVARRGFTLIELLVVIAIIALLVSILLPALGEGRRAARQAQNLANLKTYGNTLNSYSADFKELGPAFTWKGGQNYSTQQQNGSYVSYTAGNDVAAAANQAADIIRRRSAPDNSNFAVPANWIPHILYSHLVMLDYISARLPEPISRSPFDKKRIEWSEDPINFQRFGLPEGRWPYSSSYQITSASFAPDRWTIDGGSLQQAGGVFNLYQYNAGSSSRYRLGGRKLSDCRNPSGKVFAFVDVMRHKGKVPHYFTHYAAETCVVMYDASVSVRSTYDATEGGYWTASNAAPRTPAEISYEPAGQDIYGYDADPEGIPNRPGRIRWTYGQLSGVDFGQRDTIRR